MLPTPTETRRSLPVPLLVVGIATAAAVVAAAIQLGWHGRLFAGRFRFPLDLEWMEGGMLVHAQRIAAGQGIYVKPSLDFIPYLYTPLYPALLAVLSKVVPLGYVLGRAVSLLSFVGALVLMGLCAFRQATDRTGRTLAMLVAVAGAGVIVGTNEITGAFYDLARSDSLLLLFESAALVSAYLGRGLPSAIVAGVAMALAFLTKQTGPVVGVGIGLGLLLVDWRRGLVYGGVCAVLMGAGLLFLVHSSGGWFWTYVYKLHQSHPFRFNTLDSTPRILWIHGWGTLLALLIATLGLFLGGKLRREDYVLWGAALAGIVSAILGFATNWAFLNAYIPGFFFPAFAATVLAARQIAHGARSGKRGAVVMAAAAALSLGVQNLLAVKSPLAARMPQQRDRDAARRFLDQLRALPGDGFIPFHPYYSTLAGKRPYVHRMGVMDVAAYYGRPDGLDQAIAGQKFPWVILDWKSYPGEWPSLAAKYEKNHDFKEGYDSVRMFSGAETSPRWLLVPKK